MHKKVGLILILLLGFNPLFAEWSDPVLIGYGNTLDFEVDRNTGYLHIVYVGQYGPVKYLCFDSTGVAIISESDDENIIPNTTHERGRTIWGPTISVDNVGRPHVCYRSANVGTSDDSQYEIYYTYLDGNEWVTATKIFNAVGRGTMVRMLIDDQNRVHVVRSAKVSYLTSPLVSIDYKRLYNGSVVFSQTVTDTAKEYRYDSRAELAVSPNHNVHLILGCPEYQGGKVMYFLNTGGTSSFVRTANIVSVDNVNPNPKLITHAYRNGGPDVATDLNGNIHFLYGANNDLSINQKNSIRYVRYENSAMKRNVCVTIEGELSNWPSGPPNYGLGSIACTDDGTNLVIAYLTTDGGTLRVRTSRDRGVSWNERKTITSGVGGYEGRDVHLLRSHGDRFYLVYPYRDALYLVINPDIRIAPEAPAVQDVSIQGSTHLKITVDDDLAKSGYKIYRSTSSDFTPGVENYYKTETSDYSSSEDGFQLIDTDDVIGDVNHNYFYAITGVSGSKESTPSNIVGEFEYDITITGSTDLNPIGLAMDIVGVTDAASLLDYLSNCNAVVKWDPTVQGYVQYVTNVPGSNFDITPGYAYYVNATSNSILTLTGSATSPTFTLYSTTTTDFNDIMLPLDRSDISTARALAEDIGANCDAVVRFDVASQSFVQYDYDENDAGFDVEIGNLYKVNVTSTTTWPSSVGKRAKLPELTAASLYTKAPHTVRGRIEQGNFYTMRAYIKERSSELLTESSTGCLLASEKWCVQVGNFQSAWKAGDVLRVEFYDKYSGQLVDVVEMPLTYSASDKISRLCCSLSSIESTLLPEKFEVFANYPNPFNGETLIKLALPQKEQVRLIVYDVTGRTIQTLFDGSMEAGYQTVSWNGTDLHGNTVGSGVYFYKVITQNHVYSHKMVLIQ